MKQIAGYEIIAEIGQGAMATVYRARATTGVDSAPGEVAIKFLRREYLTDLGFRARFEREGALIAGLAHAAIVPVYTFGQFEEQLYIVMAYMPHGSLAERLLHSRPTFDEATAILARAGVALDYAHSQGVVHRDLKPSNILFNARDEAFLADFGIAHDIQRSGTGVDAISGTPAYMSPEQARRENTVGAASDIYALGVLAFQLLTGRLPFSGETPIAVLVQHMHEPPPSPLKLNAALPAGVDPVLAKALDKEPGQRYESAAAFIAALRRAFASNGAANVAGTGAVEAPAFADVTQGGVASMDIAGDDRRPPSDPVPERVAGDRLTAARRWFARKGEPVTSGAEALGNWLAIRPSTAFILVTLLGILSACMVVGALRGASVTAALRGEGLQEDGAAASSAVVYLPLTGAEVERTGPTATPGPTAVLPPTENMQLLVSRDAVTLLNVSGAHQSLADVTLRRVIGDGEVAASFEISGLRRVAGNAINALPPGDCLQLWRTDALIGRGPEKPATCDTLRGWLATRETNPLFQGMEEGDVFEVVLGEQRLVGCTLTDARCAFLMAQASQE